MPFMRSNGRMLWREAGYRYECGACPLHAGYIRLQTHTHTVCVVLIAFPLQPWLHERTSMLRYMYIRCLVFTAFF